MTAACGPRQAPLVREKSLGHFGAYDTEQALQRLPQEISDFVAAARRVRCLQMVFDLSSPLIVPWIAVDEREFLAAVADTDCGRVIEAQIAAIADLARYRAAAAWPAPGYGYTYFHKAMNSYWPQCFPIEDFDQYAKIQGSA